MMRSATLPRAFADSRERLAARGLNLWGVAQLEDFDPALCRGAKVGERNHDATSVIVIGTGGSALWEHLVATGETDPRRPGAVDDWTRRVLEEEVARLQAEGHRASAIFPFDRNPTCFVQMAEAAGLAVMSPVVSMLLHPRFGPWVDLRGALVVEEALPSTGELQYDPCADCDAPCLSACPVDTYPAVGRVELGRCATRRHAGGCAAGCEVRRVCPCGQDERYVPDAERAMQARVLPILRRTYGLGIWRLVPSLIRRRLFAS